MLTRALHWSLSSADIYYKLNVSGHMLIWKVFFFRYVKLVPKICPNLSLQHIYSPQEIYYITRDQKQLSKMIEIWVHETIILLPNLAKKWIALGRTLIQISAQEPAILAAAFRNHLLSSRIETIWHDHFLPNSSKLSHYCTLYRMNSQKVSL
jgi:hypothetical protein